eukprot:scaffold24155_cov152-Cylindrotheca_fusiformis.AAC.1
MSSSPQTDIPAVVDAKSYKLLKLAGICFIASCIMYLIASVQGLPSIQNEGAWVYSAIGAVGFVICGLIEFCNEMGAFHVFLIFAGIFGVIAEVLDGYKKPASVHLNFLSCHMFLLESIKVFIQHKGYIQQKVVWITALLVGDFFFFFGACVDVILSWVYLLGSAPGEDGDKTTAYLTVTRNPTQKNAELASAVIWLISGVLTTAVYIRMGKETVKPQTVGTNLSNPSAEMA